MVTMSSRQFNQEVSAAKRAADHGPVVVTDRGKPAYVLLSMDEYRRLKGLGAGLTLSERLRMAEDIDIHFPRAEFEHREIDL